MYPYHNRIKKRIANGELVSHEFVDRYNSIKEPCLLLYFNTEPYVRPVRKHKLKEYLEIIGGVKKIQIITNSDGLNLIQQCISKYTND